MFMDRKNQYSENEYTAQSNLQIQCNPYQTPNSIFQRTRTNNFTICKEIQCSSSSVTQSCPTICDPMNCNTPGPPVHYQLLDSRPQIESVMPSSHLILGHPLLLLPPIPPSIRIFSNESTLHISQTRTSIGVSALPSVLTKNTRTDLLQNGLVGSPCSPRNSQESSATPQFKSISSSVLSFLHSPTFISIPDHWKNHSLDQADLCWQSNVSAFKYAIQVGHNFSSKK